MSTLYNMLFGEIPKATILLATLGLKREDCGRYRDCCQRDGCIVIHTRNGGGNRDAYQDTIDTLAKHPCYLWDEDDDFDCTYADIFFRYPEEYAAGLKALEEGAPDMKPSEKWEILLASIKAPT